MKFGEKIVWISWKMNDEIRGLEIELYEVWDGWEWKQLNFLQTLYTSKTLQDSSENRMQHLQITKYTKCNHNTITPPTPKHRSNLQP